MKQFGLAAVAVIALATISTSVAAQDGQFFVEGGIGRSNYNLSLFDAVKNGDRTDWASSIRAGYMWHGFVNYGVELGYADLGKTTHEYDFQHNFGGSQTRQSTAAAGWMLGGRLEYIIGQSWYVLARAGWFRPDITEKYSSVAYYNPPPFLTPNPRYVQGQRSYDTGNHAYYGLGVGYCISAHWRVGLNYDYYDLGSLRDPISGYYGPSSHMGTVSATVQYGF